MFRRVTFACLLPAIALAASPVSAAEFVKNGNFSSTSATSSQQMSNTRNSVQYVDNWINTTDGAYTGYNFIVMGNAGSTPGGIKTNGGGTLSFWSKLSNDANAPSNGFTNSASIGGSGGNYLAADGAFQTALIYQIVTGLTVGQQYDLSFNWAGAQQYGFNGTTTDNWTVYFGAPGSYQSYTTETLTNASHGFTGWQKASTTFTATGATQYLAFLAKGTPDGQPPFSLLDDVSLTNRAIAAVPEPASWAMMIGGFGLVGASLRRRRTAIAA